MHEPDKSVVATFTVELRNPNTPAETWAVRDETGRAVAFAASRTIAVRAALSYSSLPNRTKWRLAVEAVDLAEAVWNRTYQAFRAQATSQDVRDTLDKADERVKMDYHVQRSHIATIFPW